MMTDRDAGYREGIEAAAEIARQNKMHWANKVDPCRPDDPSRRLYSAKSGVAFQIEMDIRALPLPPAQDDAKAEPVAWQYRFQVQKGSYAGVWSDWTIFHGEPVEMHGRKYRPLYTHPAPASDGVREALEPILQAADDEADRITEALCKPGWRPSRSRIEDARNAIRSTTRHVRAALAVQPQQPESAMRNRITHRIFPTLCWVSLQWSAWKWGVSIERIPCSCWRCLRHKNAATGKGE